MDIRRKDERMNWRHSHPTGQKDTWYSGQNRGPNHKLSSPHGRNIQNSSIIALYVLFAIRMYVLQRKTAPARLELGSGSRGHLEKGGKEAEAQMTKSSFHPSMRWDNR